MDLTDRVTTAIFAAAAAAILVLVLAVASGAVNTPPQFISCHLHSLTPGGPLVCDGGPPRPPADSVLPSQTTGRPARHCVSAQPKVCTR